MLFNVKISTQTFGVFWNYVSLIWSLFLIFINIKCEYFQAKYGIKWKQDVFWSSV